MVRGGPGGGTPGPPPAGGSFTGPAQALEIYGDFAAAYSGTFAGETTTRTRLKFTTGNYLFVGEIRLAGMFDLATPAVGGQATMTVKMNEAIVLIAKTDGSEEDMPSADKVPIIIPGYTEILIEQDASPDLYVGTISITGRIYR